MKIKIWLSKRSVEGGEELAEIVTSLEGQIESWIKQDVLDGVRYDDLGRMYVELHALVSPATIEQALENTGYEGDTVVGVNNKTGKVIFKDDINNMYIVGSMFLEYKEGFLRAEHGVAGDDDCYMMDSSVY